MTLKAKSFPIRSASPVLRAWMQTCAFILAVNWVMQGVRGMDAKERRFRLALALLLAGVFGLAALPVLPLPAAAAFGAFAAHSVNFTLNGQVWVCCRYCRWYRRDPVLIDAWLAGVIARLRRLDWLRVALCIGSQGLGRGTRGPRSDIDLRLVFPAGPLAWARTNLLLLRLRAGAFVRAIPLDLYAYDGVASLDRFRQDEPLLVILDRGGDLRRRYPARDLRPAA